MYKVKFFSGYEGKNFIGLSPEEVIKNIIEEFSLSDEEAEKYMKMYW